MKKNLRGKIREFVQSEEGRVGVKSPLTLGVATGSILLANAIVATTPAAAGAPCHDDDDCHAIPPFNCLEDHGSCETM